MKTVSLKNGIILPAIGNGTWHFGESRPLYTSEIKSLKAGIDSGMKLIDTAEMYGDGASEELIGQAIHSYNRKDLFLVSKVLPSHASGKRMALALEDTLQRLGTDYLDLYLYHWRGYTPLEETVQGLEALKAQGKIKAWGVSNFDVDDMEELWSLPGGSHCLVNQVLYHPDSRGIEFSLLPWMREHEVALMAYCPLAMAGRISKGILNHPVFLKIAGKHGYTPAQVILAWDIRDGHTIAIPKSSHANRTLENAGAMELLLDQEDLEMIDRAFTKPVRKEILDMQ